MDGFGSDTITRWIDKDEALLSVTGPCNTGGTCFYSDGSGSWKCAHRVPYWRRQVRVRRVAVDLVGAYFIFRGLITVAQVVS